MKQKLGYRFWTTKEDLAIMAYYPEVGPSWHRWWCNGGEYLEGRSRDAIVSHAKKLGVASNYHGPKSWTKAQDRVVVAMLAQVCKSVNKSPMAVVRRLERLIRRCE